MPFELQPTLRGELLELRPLRADDYDDLFAVASDPHIWEQHPESDRHTPEKFRRYFEGAMQSGGAFVVIDRATGRMLGSSRYYGYDSEAGEVEIGWTFLARSHWGGRYNGDMKRLMLEHAFQFVDRVVFLIGPDNFRSQRAVEKIGGVRVGSSPLDRSPGRSSAPPTAYPHKRPRPLRRRPARMAGGGVPRRRPAPFRVARCLTCHDHEK